MEKSFGAKINFHLDILPKEAKKVLDWLSAQKWLEKNDWYLAGGTALALKMGNRQSVDLDFFTPQNRFDNIDLLDRLSLSDDIKIKVNKDNTIYAELFKVKVSFISYPFFIKKKEMFNYGYVKILQPLDIAVMKIIAISQRGKKRDFFDLYWCAKNIEPLQEIIERLPAQYPSIAHNYHHILKSLVFFEDAENDPAPELNFRTNWKEVKNFFIKEVPKITKDIMKL